MAHQFKKGKLFIIISAIVIAIGILCFILAYGLTDGWAAVGAWFGSKYAILLYILLGLYGCIIVWIIGNERIKRL